MIAEGPLLETLQAVYTGRLRPLEAYRQIRATETPDDGLVLTPAEADLACGWANTEQEHYGFNDDEKALLKRLEEAAS